MSGYNTVEAYGDRIAAVYDLRYVTSMEADAAAAIPFHEDLAGRGHALRAR